jgi:ATP-dependent DNA helicase DinG
VAEEGGDPFRNYALPNAIIKFRQGFGRLIRHREDRGWVIIADRRIQTKSYGVNFRRNLPCAVHSAPDASLLLAEVSAFFAR